jgi:hypothetical protein
MTVDLSRPTRGLVAMEFQGDPVALLRPLQLSARARPVGEAVRLRESYVRGRDLVAEYDESDASDFLTQIYWRGLAGSPEHRLGGVDLVVSVRTQLLDSTASLLVASDAGPGELVRCEVNQAGDRLRETSIDRRQVDRQQVDRRQVVQAATAAILLFRPAGQAWSYVEMVHPSDLHEQRLTALPEREEWNRVESLLFDEPLEKGVIRRGRLRAAWLPRDNDIAAAEVEFQDFIDSPLPLTT